MAERSFGMEMMKRPKIKSMSYEDFNDNEYICLLYTSDAADD